MFNKLFRKREKIEDYYYVVNESTKTVVECTEKRQALLLSKLYHDLPVYDHFPHQEYGYEDSYLFLEEWAVYSDAGTRVEVKIVNGLVEVVE